jgi:hypothetical protein
MFTFRFGSCQGKSAISDFFLEARIIGLAA